jgi:hypothetical protein
VRVRYLGFCRGVALTETRSFFSCPPLARVLLIPLLPHWLFLVVLLSVSMLTIPRLCVDWVYRRVVLLARELVRKVIRYFVGGANVCSAAQVQSALQLFQVWRRCACVRQRVCAVSVVLGLLMRRPLEPLSMLQIELDCGIDLQQKSVDDLAEELTSDAFRNTPGSVACPFVPLWTFRGASALGQCCKWCVDSGSLSSYDVVAVRLPCLYRSDDFLLLLPQTLTP